MEQKFAPNRNKTVMILETTFIAQKEHDAPKQVTKIKDTRNKITDHGTNNLNKHN
jgi:hypothetical protein